MLNSQRFSGTVKGFIRAVLLVVLLGSSCTSGESLDGETLTGDRKGNSATFLLELLTGTSVAPALANPELVIQTCVLEGGFQYFIADADARSDWVPTDEQFGIGLTGLLSIEGIDEILPSLENPNLEYTNSLPAPERSAYQARTEECFSQLEVSVQVSPEVLRQRDDLVAQLTRVVGDANLRADIDERTVESRQSWKGCMEQGGYTVNSFQELRELVANRLTEGGFGSVLTSIMALDLSAARQKIGLLEATEAKRFEEIVDFEAAVATVHNDCRRPEADVRRVVFEEYDRLILVENQALEGEVLEFVAEHG